MKKIISIFLIFILCFLSSSQSILAQTSYSQYTADEKDLIYSQYSSHEQMLHTLFSRDAALGYWSTVNNTEKDAVLKWSIDTASKLIGQYPDKQDYAEILANLMAMQSGHIAEQIQNQSQFDNLKDGKDYVMDIADIASNFIGGFKLLQSISPIIDTATNGAEVIIKNTEHAKYYETAIQDYSESKMFLEAIRKYAEDEELRNVAGSLLAANDKLLEKRLEYLTDVTDELIKYGAEFFIENMSFALLKNTDLYETDDTVRWYIDCSSKLMNSVLSLKSATNFAFDLTILIGDLVFGTSDTFNRYHEMKIVSEIAEALVRANNQIVISQKINEDTLTDIKAKCDYYKMLIVTHARGEYLIYQLLIHDAKLHSLKSPKDITENWYNEQIECLVKYYNILDHIFKITGQTITSDQYKSLAGHWTIDINKTHSSNDLSLQSAFGTGIKYGHELVLNEDGTVSWYIGIGNGGDGTYTIQDTSGSLNYIDYDDKIERMVPFSIVQESGKNYILMEYENYTLCWIKKDSPDLSSSNKISRKNYYNSDGLLIYYESYAYYDNGLLCSTTLHSVHYDISDNSSYIKPQYTFLYLYDKNGALIETIFDILYLDSWYDQTTDELILDYEYDDFGNSTPICIHPQSESIEQEKFGVDPSKTNEIYDNAPVLSAKSANVWAATYLNDIFSDSEQPEMALCRLFYVDNNSIPEIWIDYGYSRSFNDVYTQGDNGTDCIAVSHGAAEWIENKNLLLLSGAHMDVYYDELYQIQNGTFVLIDSGSYGALVDKPGNYYWNDSQVTEDQYTQNLNAAFDRTQAVDSYQNIYTYNQCRLLLQSLVSNTASSSAEEPAENFEPSIPSDAESFEEHHYKFFTLDSVKTWEEARDYCETLGGYLAKITSSEENNFLYQLMVDAGYTNAYFGITDSYNEGSWVCFDGTELTYTNWHSREPNSENSNEDYGMFYWKYTDGTWNDGDFGRRTNKGGTTFICEWDN